jgi:hypothetical protein
MLRKCTREKKNTRKKKPPPTSHHHFCYEKEQNENTSQGLWFQSLPGKESGVTKKGNPVLIIIDHPFYG